MTRNSNEIMLYETEKMSPWVRHEKLRRHDSRLRATGGGGGGGTRAISPAAPPTARRGRRSGTGDAHGLRVADLEELEVLRLDLDALALGQLGASHAERVSLAQPAVGRETGGGQPLPSSSAATVSGRV